MTKTAMKSNAGKPRMSLLPPAALVDIVRVREFGCQKYDDWDWTKARPWTEYSDAAERHIMAWAAGQDNDEESGLNHLAHAACNMLFLLEFAKSGAGKDDRPTGLVEFPDYDPRQIDIEDVIVEGMPLEELQKLAGGTA